MHRCYTRHGLDCLIYWLLFLVLPSATIAQALPRVDNPWVLGYEPVSVGPFGRTTIDFNETVEVDSLDVFPPFEFDWTNKSYRIPNTSVSVYSNGCAVVRDLSDTIFRIDLNQTTAFLNFRYCSERIGSAYSAFLPLGKDTLAVLYGLERLGNPTTGFFNISEGYGIAYLSIDSILLNQDITKAVLGTPKLWLPMDTLLRSSVGVTAHPNGGWWIVSKGLIETNRWRVLHLSSDALIEKDLQYVGPKSKKRDNFAVRFVFSPSGTKFVSVGSHSGIHTYDFDLQTGDISLNSSAAQPNPEWEPFRYFGNAAWSVNEEHLYITDETSAWQLNVNAMPLDSGFTRIDPPARPGRRNGYMELSRGPDCRIYIGPPGAATYLSVIDKPDLPGAAIDFKNRGMPIKYIYVGIPKFPDYHTWSRARVARGLAPLIDTAVCDPTILPYDYLADPVSSTFNVATKSIKTARVWPSMLPSFSANEVVNLEWPKAHKSITVEFTVSVIDASGVIISSNSVQATPVGDGNKATLRIQRLVPGYYTIQIAEKSSGKPSAVGRLIVQ